MYDNNRTTYGYEMTFSDYIDRPELESWADEVRNTLDETPAEWHCFVDMRDLETMSPDAQELMSDVKSECHDCGLSRVATLVESPTVRLQFEQMSEGTGGTKDRYLDAQTTDDPEETAVAWVRDGVDPEA